MNFSAPEDRRFEPGERAFWPDLDPSQVEMPEDALWQRIRHTRGRRRRHRQLLATAAVGLFGVVLGAGLMSPLAPWNDATAPFAEQPVAAQPESPTSPADFATAAANAAAFSSDHEALRAIDRRLQAAYDRNAGADEIRRLWQVRDALLAQPMASEAATVIEL